MDWFDDLGSMIDTFILKFINVFLIMNWDISLVK